MDDAAGKADSDMEVDEPLDISWPTENKKRISYVLMAPIIFPLWATLPDVRRDVSNIILNDAVLRISTQNIISRLYLYIYIE